MNTIINPELFTKDGLHLPSETTKTEWEAVHRYILVCKKTASKWLNQSRTYATDRWGVEYAASAEFNIERDLWGNVIEDKPSINPTDKSQSMVTIEGIAQHFSMWQRKMHNDIPSWQPAQIKRALELLEPIEAQAKALRAMLQ